MQIDEANQELIPTLNQAWESAYRKGPPQSLTPQPQSALAVPSLEVELISLLSKQIHRMIVQEVRHEYVGRSHETTQQAVKNSLSELFIASTVELDEGMRTPFYQNIKIIIASKAKTETLSNVFGCSIDCWTQSAFFKDAFARRTLKAPHFTRPTATLINSKMYKNFKEWPTAAKAKALPPWGAQ